MYLYPNGMTPLTAILSMMSQKKVDDPQFHWWTQMMGSVGGAVAGVYTLPDLSVAYAGGAAAGAMVGGVPGAIIGGVLGAAASLLG